MLPLQGVLDVIPQCGIVRGGALYIGGAPPRLTT